jgi:hypothetical protein
MQYDLNSIVQGAKANRAVPYSTYVPSKDVGIKLAEEIKTLLLSKGFINFEPILGDKHNSFCEFSIKGERPVLLGGKKASVHVCIRVFSTRSGAVHTDLTIQ